MVAIEAGAVGAGGVSGRVGGAAGMVRMASSTSSAATTIAASIIPSQRDADSSARVASNVLPVTRSVSVEADATTCT